MFDLNQMMGKVKEAQEAVKRAQENLVNITAQGESGGGMIKATINGHRQVIKIELDDDLIKPEDKKLIEDLTVAAVNKALEAIELKIKDEMQKHTQGIIPNIPGMDFGNFG